MKSARALQNKFKQTFTLFQIFTSLPSVLSLVFPDVYVTIISSFEIINFSFFNDLGFSCRLNKYDYVDYLFLNTISPIVVCVVLLIMAEMHVFYVKYRFHRVFYEVANVKHRVVSARHSYYFLILMVIYVTLPGKELLLCCE